MTPVEKPQPTLADQFVADLAKWPNAFKLKGRSRKLAEEYGSKFRQEMRKAHRFVLDDDFTRYSSEVSTRTTDPRKLLYRLQYATLPYEYTWLEFNSREKMKVLRAIHRPGETFSDIHEVPERMAMLLHRLSDTTWICTIVCSPTHDDMPIIPNLLSLLISIDEREFDRSRSYDDCEVFRPDIGAKFWNDVPREAAHHIAVFGKAALWGYGSGWELLDGKQANKHYAVLPDYLKQHGDVAMSRAFGMFFADIAVLHGGAQKYDKMSEVMAVELREFTGFGRWIVTVLAMLNEVPLRARHVKPEGNYVTRMGAKKYMDYHALTLMVPKLRPIPYIERKLSNRNPHKNRAHEVRSHWRTYLGDDPCRREEHDWSYDHDEGYRLCGRCMSFSRLIHEHVRGDPKLGWTNKHYVVEKTKGAEAA